MSLSSLPASAARPPEAQCRMTGLSKASDFSAVGDDRSTLNSSEPRGMCTEPAALPVEASSALSRLGTVNVSSSN